MARDHRHIRNVMLPLLRAIEYVVGPGQHPTLCTALSVAAVAENSASMAVPLIGGTQCGPCIQQPSYRLIPCQPSSFGFLEISVRRSLVQAIEEVAWHGTVDTLIQVTRSRCTKQASQSMFPSHTRRPGDPRQQPRRRGEQQHGGPTHWRHTVRLVCSIAEPSSCPMPACCLL